MRTGIAILCGIVVAVCCTIISIMQMIQNQRNEVDMSNIFVYLLIRIIGSALLGASVYFCINLV